MCHLAGQDVPVACQGAAIVGVVRPGQGSGTRRPPASPGADGLISTGGVAATAIGSCRYTVQCVCPGAPGVAGLLDTSRAGGRVVAVGGEGLHS